MSVSEADVRLSTLIETLGELDRAVSSIEHLLPGFGSGGRLRRVVNALKADPTDALGCHAHLPQLPSELIDLLLRFTGDQETSGASQGETGCTVADLSWLGTSRFDHAFRKIAKGLSVTSTPIDILIPSPRKLSPVLIDQLVAGLTARPRALGTLAFDMLGPDETESHTDDNGGKSHDAAFRKLARVFQLPTAPLCVEFRRWCPGQALGPELPPASCPNVRHLVLRGGPEKGKKVVYGPDGGQRRPMGLSSIFLAMSGLTRLTLDNMDNYISELVGDALALDGAAPALAIVEFKHTGDDSDSGYFGFVFEGLLVGSRAGTRRLRSLTVDRARFAAVPVDDEEWLDLAELIRHSNHLDTLRLLGPGFSKADLPENSVAKLQSAIEESKSLKIVEWGG